MSIQILREEIKNVTDPRRQWGNFCHSLEEILIIGLCAIVCGGEDFDDMEEFAYEKEDWLRGYLELPYGIPVGDTFRRVFERLDSNEVSECLSNWLAVQKSGGQRNTVNLDGKTICGSGNDEHSAYHVVSAWVAETGITLGEIAVDEKSNEITAIPKLLDLLDITGDTVTVDAMGTQTKIAEKIISKGADYVLALKGNQVTLHEDVKLYYQELGTCGVSTLEKGHGRVEKREYFLETDIDWLFQKPDWVGLNGIGMVRSSITKKGVMHQETRYYITSLTDIQIFADSVRKHWSIENQLHWMLDVVFHEDDARARKDNSPLNMNVLRKTALTLLKNAKTHSKLSIRKKSFKAALNTKFLESVLFQK